jgi:hypothetical protein
MGLVPRGLPYFDSYREGMKILKESERISPKEYGMILQRKKRKRKKRGGRQ